jgi:two component regulator with propeller domain
MLFGAGNPRVIETFQVGPTVYVRALAVEPARGTLWVGTSAGLNEVDLASGKLRATLTRRDGLASEQVFALAVDSQGYKWIGTSAGGVSRYRDGSFKTYFPMHGLADYRVFSVAQDARGAVWMGTLAGASRLDRASGKFATYAKELVNEWVYGIAVDAKGQVWFATEGGISMFDGKRWRAWTQADGLGVARAERGNYILSVHAAKDGSIWAGTWGSPRKRGSPATSSTASRRKPTARSGSAPTAGSPRTTEANSRTSGRVKGCRGRTCSRSRRRRRARSGRADAAPWRASRGDRRCR